MLLRQTCYRIRDKVVEHIFHSVLHQWTIEAVVWFFLEHLGGYVDMDDQIHLLSSDEDDEWENIIIFYYSCNLIVFKMDFHSFEITLFLDWHWFGKF